MTPEEFSTLKVGDTVCLPKKCPDMATTWVGAMDKLIGKPLTVLQVDYTALTCKAGYKEGTSFVYTADALEFMYKICKKVVVGDSVFQIRGELPEELPLKENLKELNFYIKLAKEYKQRRKQPEELVVYAYNHRQRLLAPLIANGVITKEN